MRSVEARKTTEARRIAIDLTGTQRPRVTGWERFALSFYDHLRQSEAGLVPIPLRWRRSSRGRADSLARQLLWHAVGLRVAAHRARADVVHATTFPPGRTGLPTIWTVHDDLILGGHPQFARRGARAWVPLARRALRWTDIVVTDTHAVAQQLVDVGLASSRIRIATPGVPSLPQPRRPDGAVRRVTADTTHDLPSEFLLYIGTLEPRKRPDVAVRAAAQLDLPLVMVGRFDPTLDRAAIHGYRHAYQLQSLADAELSWLYRNMVALIAPSAYEGLDLPVLEALGAGGRVAASDISVHREIAGEHAAYASVGDWQATAQAVLDAPKPDRWAAPTWQGCVAAYTSAYDELGQ